MTGQTQDERRFAALWGTAALACLALVPWAPLLARWIPPCPFKTVTTVPCPFCGTTRAALALGRFDPLHGLVHFPLPTLFWIVFLAGGLLAGACAVLNRPFPNPRRLPRGVVIGLAVAVLVNWVYSMVTGV